MLFTAILSQINEGRKKIEEIIVAEFREYFVWLIAYTHTHIYTIKHTLIRVEHESKNEKKNQMIQTVYTLTVNMISYFIHPTWAECAVLGFFFFGKIAMVDRFETKRRRSLIKSVHVYIVCGEKLYNLVVLPPQSK